MSIAAMTSEPIATELRSLADSGDYTQIVRRSAQLACRAKRSEDPEQLVSDLVALASEGSIAALIAVESLAGIRDPHADDALVGLLRNPEQIVRRHAAWRLGERQPTPDAYPALVDMLTLGGIDTMHAHRTMRRWSSTDSTSILRLVVAKLVTSRGAAERARLVDLLGVIEADTDDFLLIVALDANEASAVRNSAIGALGERSGDRIATALSHLAASDDVVGTAAALALTSEESVCPSTAKHDGSVRLRVAQLVLAEGLDGQLSLGGKGDTGGVASLLVSLGEALADVSDVGHVLTIGRGALSDVVAGPLSSSRSPQSYDMVAFGDEARPVQNPSEFWEHLPVIERSLRRVLRRAGPTDVLHLRMADAGTLAGAEVAATLGIPVCFSVAPDPHNVIDSLQRRGELDDESFVKLATDTHVWFRARMVERLTSDAEMLALFPRSRPIDFLEDITTTQPGQRIATIAEGIDLRLLDHVRTMSSAPVGFSRSGDILDELAASIPAARRHLPLALSVGRLNPVKGMDRVVAAWTSDPRLQLTCNLVIVGGDLDMPSAIESTVLAEIDRAIPPADERRAGLVLLGGRPRLDVARLLTSVAVGRVGAWSGGGVYVDGALKEEFGLAVLEALAAGLVVVAPSTGGPTTYVDHGDTGILVDPDGDLAVAISDAFDLVDRPGRAARARSMVEEEYSIDTMAAKMVELYRPAMAFR
ncbi:MAG: glycosyltransferase involved in cell wall biosynthesis [Acidimicrobiales bacterium]|jgi:glycosyltransferase involved in cell wall biosynthesis